MNRIEKEQQSLYLSEGVIAGLKSIATAEGKSVSQLADDMLTEAIQAHRSKRVVLERIEVLEQNLPPTLYNMPLTHPIFGRKKPSEVLTRQWGKPCVR